jgi:D-alanyl-lipoteichoic acid acyltransferase DltB (MBOAT superfamily)
MPAIIKKDKTNITTNFNLLTTMLLGGLWHGASWNFIIWGAMHGIALAMHKIWTIVTGKSLGKIGNSKLYNAIAIFITFHFVCFCWIFFKAGSMEDATNMIYQITHDLSFSVWNAFFNNYSSVLFMIGMAAVMHSFPDNLADKLVLKLNRVPMPVYITLFFVFVLIYGFFKSAEPVMPIYLQF